MMETSIESSPDKVPVESETNGETSTEEVIESEVTEKEGAQNDDAESEDKIDKESEDKTEGESKEESIEDNETQDCVNDSENESEKKSLKRKLDVSEASNEDIIDDNVESQKEIIEDENPPKKIKKAEEKDPVINLPINDVFGKGKRARIPNKRYSDIAISPSVKPSKLHIENGEKEKISATEHIEPERLDTNSPLPKRVKMSSVDMGNPNFLKPFDFGWRRELVWRATGADTTGNRIGDIYYYSPEGKKLRSMREVGEHLNLTTKNLTIDNFTFYKEPLGLNDPDKEIIRDAKIKSGAVGFLPSKKSASVKLKKGPSQKLSSGSKITSPKVSSPKLETSSAKITSPPQNSAKQDNSEATKTPKSSKLTFKAASSDSGNEGKNTKSPPLKVKLTPKVKTEKKPSKEVSPVTEESPMAGKKGNLRKSNRWSQNSGGSGDTTNKACEPCSIRCPGVQGFVPTLQCRLCLCLYHNECMGLVANLNIPNYVCKNCQLEQGGQNMSTGIAPPPLTPITALQSVTTQPTALPKLQRIPKSPEGDPVPPAPNNDRVDDVSAQIGENASPSILGHVTSWLPQNSRIQVGNQQRSTNEIAEPARPQYVEYLAGRKFLIIPKYNIVSVSPTVGIRSSQPSQTHETVDLVTGQTADVATTTVKSEPVSPSKPENSQTSESAQPTIEHMEVGDEDVKPLVENIDLLGDP